MSVKAREVFSLLRSWAAYAALPAAGVITAPILARALGPAGRGQLAGILQPLTLAGAIAAIGVPSAVTYFIAQQRPTKKVIDLGLRIAFIMTILVGVFLVAYSRQVAATLAISRIEMLIIWSAFIPSAIVAVRRAHLQGTKSYQTLDLERVLMTALRVGAIVVLWLLGIRSVLVYAAGYMLAGLAASLILITPPQAVVTTATIKETLSAKTFVRFSLLSSFGSIASAMSSRLDQAIMPAIVDVKQLGFYSVAVAVAEIPSIITAVIGRNIFAEVGSGTRGARIGLTVLFGVLAQLTLIGVMLVSLPFVLPTLFGGDFDPASELIWILMVSSFANYLAVVGASYLAGLGRPGLSSAGQAVAAVATGLLFWAYWRQMDALTAAWVSVMSQSAAVAVLASTLLSLRFARESGRRNLSLSTTISNKD